ncbi:MAG: uncharacterized protein A8A55_2195 [Amphiamblys sp. WSBS2006]|nr:MAG: uncharacterized protein A8A55_2195 [Amphiamblys sp. WSBS2006]
MNTSHGDETIVEVVSNNKEKESREDLDNFFLQNCTPENSPARKRVKADEREDSSDVLEEVVLVEKRNIPAKEKTAKKSPKKRKRRLIIKLKEKTVLSGMFLPDETIGEILNKIPLLNKDGYFLSWNKNKIYSANTLEMLGIKTGSVLDLKKEGEERKETEETPQTNRIPPGFLILALRHKTERATMEFETNTKIGEVIARFNTEKKKECRKMLFDGEVLDKEKTITECELEDEDLVELL